MTNQGPGRKPRTAGKPVKTTKPTKSAKPGQGLMGWLGRQVGHVKGAVKADVTKGTGDPKPAPAKPTPSSAKPASPTGASRPSAASTASTPPPSKVIFREDRIEEAELPDRPGVKLRRTIIDEVVVEGKGDEPTTP